MTLPSRDPWDYWVWCGPAGFLPTVAPAPGPHCGRCGYARSFHEGAKQRCPGLVTGGWQERPPIDASDWRAIMARDARKRFEDAEAARRPYVSPVVGPPQVPPRPPVGPEELASYHRKQAAGLGRVAVAVGWSARALYWRGHDGGEGCGVWLLRGPLRALATWSRPAGSVGKTSGWSADVAYAWRIDVQGFPTKVTHTYLEEIVSG